METNNKNNNEREDISTEDETPPVESKFKKILNKLISKPYSAAAIIAASLFIVIALTVLIFSLGKKDPSYMGEDPNASENHTSIQIIENVAPAYEEFSRQLKLFFFEHNINKDDINELLTESPEGQTYSVTVNKTFDADDPIWQKLHDLLQINNFHSISHDNGSILAKSSDYDIMLNLMQAKPKEDFTTVVSKRGKIALLLDDAGANYELVDRITKQQIPMAIAVLPHLQYSRQSADLIRARGKLVFLHYPMEPTSYPADDPGEGAVLTNMPEILIQGITKSNVESLGKIDGVNNHMGSAVTQDAEKMSQVLDSLRPYTNVFVDSNTSAKSVALKICREKGFKCGLNRKFLDNENNHDYIKNKLYEAAKLSDSQGGIIVIGHIRPDTIIVLDQMIPELQKMGYEFVNITSLLD